MKKMSNYNPNSNYFEDFSSSYATGVTNYCYQQDYHQDYEYKYE